MLPIVVSGKGLIPRTGMIAPVKKPFKVDLKTLGIIVRTPRGNNSLKAYYINEKNSKIELTVSNYVKVFNEYQNQTPTFISENIDSTDIKNEKSIPRGMTTPIMFGLDLQTGELVSNYNPDSNTDDIEDNGAGLLPEDTDDDSKENIAEDHTNNENEKRSSIIINYST